MKSNRSLVFLILLLGSLFLLTGCGESTTSSETNLRVFKIGAIMPLTGDGAAYGLPTQRVVEQAVKDVNEEWVEKKQKLEIIFEDGKCNPKDGLTAAQNLVNLKGIKLIMGGACSGETMGLAPFVNQERVLAFSTLSSSPDITEAGGDFVFRNYPSDTAQVSAMMGQVRKDKPKRVAILSENTDYAQALRKGYKKSLQAEGITISADETIDSETKDLRTEVLKLVDSDPDAVVLIPQTIPMGVAIAKQWKESGSKVTVYGGEVIALNDIVEKHGDLIEGYYSVRLKFNDKDPKFTALDDLTECGLGAYCVSTYDGVLLIAELLDECGNVNSDCVKEKLYATQNWEGFAGARYSFDEHGDVAGEFEVFQVRNGEVIVVS